MTTHEAQDAPAGAVARRTVLGAAWSVPVVALAVGAPSASASDGDLTASLAWIDPPGVQNESSLLQLKLQPAASGSPVIHGTGTLTLTVVESYAFQPAQSVDAPPGWAVTSGGRTIVIVAPEGETAGTKGFNVDWGMLSGNWTVVATWTESAATGSVSATIVIGPRGFPALHWNTNPVDFGGTSTLRMTVPADCYALGAPAYMVCYDGLPADSTIVTPAGWALSDQPFPGGKVVTTASLAAGTFDFGFTIGSGDTAVTVATQWVTTAAGSTPIYPDEPLRITSG